MNCVKYTTTIIPGDEDEEMTEIDNIDDYEYMNWSSDDDVSDSCGSADDRKEFDTKEEGELLYQLE